MYIKCQSPVLFIVFLKRKLHFAQCFSREMMVKVIMIAMVVLKLSCFELSSENCNISSMANTFVKYVEPSRW